MKIFDKLITNMIDKKIEEKENELKISDLRKAKMSRFIIDLLFLEETKNNFNEKLKIIYDKHHQYNTHPYKYDGELSVDKIFVHLINLDVEDLLNVINDLTD